MIVKVRKWKIELGNNCAQEKERAKTLKPQGIFVLVELNVKKDLKGCQLSLSITYKGKCGTSLKMKWSAGVQSFRALKVLGVMLFMVKFVNSFLQVSAKAVIWMFLYFLRLSLCFEKKGLESVKADEGLPIWSYWGIFSRCISRCWLDWWYWRWKTWISSKLICGGLIDCEWFWSVKVGIEFCLVTCTIGREMEGKLERWKDLV